MFDFQDCYKTMISDLCTWDSTFMSEGSKWVDDCSPSVGSNLVTLKNFILTEAINDQSLIGGTVIDGRGCWQFAEWTKWTPYVAQSGYKMLQDTFNLFPESQTAAQVE